MLSLVTGTPGAGKTLYTVWEICRKVPGTTVEKEGQPIPRRLLTNIRDLLIEHEKIGADELDTWHKWAQPGDVIVFDEVQELWRPRTVGSKVPDCIAALETHRHMGVDIVLITQHPMLVDSNVRRLVNQHIHLRRLSKATAYKYEWDHCGQPGQYKQVLHSALWFHPKKAYELYKSAQVHTKPTARIPKIAYLGLAALAALAYLGPMAYGRIAGRFEAKPPAYSVANPPPGFKPLAAASAPGPAATGAGLPASAPSGGVPVARAEVRPMGCIASPTRCECFSQDGTRLSLPVDACREGSYRVGYTIPGDLAAGQWSEAGKRWPGYPDNQRTQPVAVPVGPKPEGAVAQPG